MKLSIKDFFSKCNLITFIEETLNVKLYFLGSGFVYKFTFCTQHSPTWSCMYQVTGSSRSVTRSGISLYLSLWSWVDFFLHFRRLLESVLTPRIFYLTGSSTNFCSIALTLLLIVAFWFPILISIICDSKVIVQFKYQS